MNEKTLQAGGCWDELFDAAKGAISIQDVNFKIIRANKAYCEMVHKKPEEIIGKYCYELIHGTCDPVPGCPWLQARETKKPAKTEMFEPRLATHAEISVSAIADKKGDVAGYIHTVINISDRKYMEGELKTGREDLHNIIKKNVDGIIVVNKEGVMRFVNPAAEALFGRTAQDLKGEMFGFPLVAGESIEIDIFHKGERTGIGEMRKVETNWDGEKAHLIIIRDVTDRTKAEKRSVLQNTTLQAINGVLMEALSHDTEEKIAEKYLAIVMELTSSKLGFVAEPDPEGRLTILSMAGTDADDKAKQEMRSILSKTRIADNPLLDGIFRQGDSKIVNEPGACSKREYLFGNNVKIESLMGVPYKQADKTVGMVALANKLGGYDNADREDVQATTFALEAAIMRKRSEKNLKETLGKLADSNKELEQFAYVASHDLQEPLRVIASYLQLIQDRYADKLDEKGMDFIARAFNGSKRMQTKIDDLLSYSRITTRAEPFAPCSGETILQTALENLETAVRKSGAIITHDPFPEVMAAQNQMVSLFQNLIGNAIKYCANGEKPAIHLSATREEDGWLFSVKDNGIGIESEFYGRIFEVFQRLHTRDAYAGNGIGLAICKKIVERHKGKIRVESTVGKGSTFYFTIPAVKEGQQ
jgi:PAS domain S-box-containing protein